MGIKEGDVWLRALKKRMDKEFENGNALRPEELTVREFIGKFGWSKRTPYLLNHVRNQMESLDLRMTPDFGLPYLGATMLIELDTRSAGAESESQSDPTHRIDMLEAANRPPMRVTSSAALNVATTIMLFHDYSQLPVMDRERDLKGIVSWESIGSRLSLGRDCKTVRDCMVKAQEIPGTTPLFEAIGVIVEHGYVLIRAADRKISGIVTASDLSEQFVSMAGPFLFIGQIEGHLRQLIHRKFTIEELRNSSLSQDRIEGAADLSLGDYQQLLGKPENWEKLNLEIDRKEFVHHLERVREIRNEVMHFDPDGLEEDDVRMLRDVARFFENLVQMKAM